MPKNKPTKTISISEQDEQALMNLAQKMGLTWGGKGNFSKLIERIAILSRAYPDRFPFPVKLADYLASRIQQGDSQAEELLEYLESWSYQRAWEEAVAEGVIVIKNNGGFIV